MPELKTSVRTPRFRWMLAGFGGGAGMTIAIAAIQAMKYRPEFVPQLLNGGFLFFAALICGMVIVDRKADRFLAVQERTVVAQEHLATNVGDLVAKISTKDEAAAQADRERDITLNHLARQMDETLKHVVELRKQHGGE